MRRFEKKFEKLKDIYEGINTERKHSNHVPHEAFLRSLPTQ